MEGTSRPTLLAPATAASSVIAGIVAALIGVWNIGECARFQTRPDECDKTIETSLPAVIAGASTISAALGGFWTYNRKLSRPRRRDESGRFASTPEN